MSKRILIIAVLLVAVLALAIPVQAQEAAGRRHADHDAVCRCDCLGSDENDLAQHS